MARVLYTPLLGITLMVFYVFALQCVSTIAVVRRETNGWKWPVFQWLYMTALAWVLAFVTWHGANMLKDSNERAAWSHDSTRRCRTRVILLTGLLPCFEAARVARASSPSRLAISAGVKDQFAGRNAPAVQQCARPTSVPRWPG